MTELGEDKLEASEATPPPQHGFLFMLCAGRSGSTLLQRILNTVEKVVMWGEHGGFLTPLANAYFNTLQQPAVQNWIFERNTQAVVPSEMVEKDLRDPRKWQAWTNWFDQSAFDTNFRQFIESFFRPDGLPSEVLWGFKEIRYGGQDKVAPMLMHLYPDARCIISVREPIAQISSMVVAFGADPVVSAKRWAGQYGGLLELRKDYPDRFHIVRYEDLIGRPVEVLDVLFAWLGLGLVGEAQLEVLEVEDGRGSAIREGKTPEEIIGPNFLPEVLEQVRAVAIEFGYSSDALPPGN